VSSEREAVVRAAGEATELCARYGCTIHVKFGRSIWKGDLEVLISPHGAELVEAARADSQPVGQELPADG
jgi:hypothetical protein